MLTALPNEKLLLAQIADGNDKAFASLYHSYYEGLFRLVQSIIKSPQLAEDLSQEIFMKIWEHRQELPQLQSFANYLFIVARNHSLNALKKASAHTGAISAIVRHIPETQNDAHEKLALEGYREYIQRTLDSLPPKTREVFLLCRQEHKSHEEIATLLGISRIAVKKHMHRSNQVFRNTIDKELIFFILLLDAITRSN